MEPELPLPALRITALLNRTFGPPAPTGQYALIVNWDPQDPSFTLRDKSMKEGEHGKFFNAWTPAYQAALAAIGKIEDPMLRKILRRGLTPTPLQFLSAGIHLKPCGEGDFAGASFG